VYVWKAGSEKVSESSDIMSSPSILVTSSISNCKRGDEGIGGCCAPRVVEVSARSINRVY